MADVAADTQDCWYRLSRNQLLREKIDQFMEAYIHGPQTCRMCFSGEEKEQRMDEWRLTNNPGYYGSSNPKILVLGFSKGANQNKEAESGYFDRVAFAGARHRLQKVLETLRLMPSDRGIDALMTAEEADFGVAYLVRCSFCKLKDGKWKTSGDVIPSAFTNRVTLSIIEQCARQHLKSLPKPVKLVVLLGTSDTYIQKVTQLAREMHKDWRYINEVAFEAGGARWIFATHPSPGNGYFEAWVTKPSSDKSGGKRILALEALEQLGAEKLA
jgi:hypothetical protein